MANGGKRPGAGRKKGSVAKHTLEAQELRKRYIERVAPIWDDLIDAQIEKASVGDMRAIEEINNRVLGKSIQPLAGTDPEGNILPFQIIVKQQPSGENRS